MHFHLGHTDLQEDIEYFDFYFDTPIYLFCSMNLHASFTLYFNGKHILISSYYFKIDEIVINQGNFDFFCKK